MLTAARLALPCILLIAAAGVWGQERPAEPWRPAMDVYEQRLVVRFTSEEAARLARLEVLPLHGGKEWSVSCRWDDMNREDLQMRDVMEAHGYRGTWYLNEPREWFGAEMGRRLLVGGNSIGGHAMTHPYLTFVSRNRLFWEVAAVRALWEAACDVPVCSHAFPFEAFRNSIEGDDLHRDIAEALWRAGYYHVPNGNFNNRVDTGFVLSPLLPPDGAPIDERAAQYLASQDHQSRYAHMSFSMHVWYRTPEAWEQFERQLDAYGRRPDWWYCNQNQYAAYRYQYQHTALAAEPRGAELHVTLRRPLLRELNDAVPLTLAARGVEPAQVVGIQCDTADVEALRAKGTVIFDLHHDRSQRLPAAIGIVQNPDNRPELGQGDSDADFPGLLGLLHFAGDALELTLDPGGEPLQEAHVTFRLPLRWEQGVVRQPLGTVTGRLARRLPLVEARPDYKYCAGAAFYVAQVDFVRAGVPGRLHLTCSVPPPPRDPSYPQGGFLVLGPVPEGSFDRAQFEQAAASGRILEELPPFARALGLRWQPGPARAAELLDPEVIETTADWRNEGRRKDVYLLRSLVESDSDLEVRALYDRSAVASICVNGQPAQERFLVRKGANELVMAVQLNGAWFHETNAGCFLRLVDARTGARARGIRFGAGAAPR